LGDERLPKKSGNYRGDIAMKIRLTRYAALVLAVLMSPPIAYANNYPSHAVVLLTSTPAGNGPDVIARLVADGLSRLWHQQVVVENRPGGRAVVATLAAKNAMPNGYTLYVALGSTFVILPEIQPNLPFDLNRDIIPVGMIGAQPFVIAVDPKLGVNTLAELVALSQRRPNEILYGCFRGSAPHLAAELLQTRSGAKLKFVPYTGTAQVVADILGGTVSVVMESLPALVGPIKSGQLKALAVTSSKRLPEFPDLPTVAESFPGYEATGWFVLMAPTGTPDAIRDKINSDLRTVLNQPNIREKFATLGTYSIARSPSEVARYIQEQRKLWRPVVHQIGLIN
jgi:tripartite-type tricarboxylate transporter receptor subunit TctC